MDVTDVAIIFAFCICVIVIAFASAIHTAYRLGWAHGKGQGILVERERRRGLEARVEQKIAETFGSVNWEKDLDV